MSLSFPWLTALFALVAGFASLPGLAPLAELTRDPVGQGEVWRLVTGHFTHWSTEHLLFDLLAFALLGTLLEWRSRRLLAGIVLMVPLVLSSFLWLFEPSLSAYRGLSGIDSALYVALCGALLREARARQDRAGLLTALVLGLAFVAKVGFESQTGAALFASTGGVVVLPAVHGLGAAVGVLLSSARSLRSYAPVHAQG